MDLFSTRTWENYDRQGLIKARLKLVRLIIPADVKSILDAGCGNGVITNSLQVDYDITGLDFSAAALEYVKTVKVLGSVTSLPFEDKAFDLCMCNEVLEHLSDSELAAAVSELKRCARKYILISVPNREHLEFSMIKCKACAYVFHAYGHYQSFDLARLDRLFQSRRLSQYTLGPWQRRFHLSLLRYRQNTLKQWFSPEIDIPCPQCSKTDIVAGKTLSSKLINGVNRITTIPRRYWLMALYELVPLSQP